MSEKRSSLLSLALKCTGVLAVALLAAAQPAAADDVGTAFTYQGDLQQGGVPVNASCGLFFNLYDAAGGGSPIGSIGTTVSIVDGRFTVTLDFGAAAFIGESRFLEIWVCCPAGDCAFEVLAPRQELTPAPFSLATRGLNVDTSGRVGIGTANPEATLTIDEGTAGLWTDGIRLINGANFWDIRSTSTGYLFFGLNENAELVFTNNGNVGIGTTNPVSKLQVLGDLTFQNTGGFRSGKAEIRTAGDMEFNKNIDSSTNDGSWFRWFTEADTIETMRISAGNEASILGDGTFTSNGLDYAEAFKVLGQESDLEAGDVVSLALGQWEYARRTAQRYDAHIIGVVSTQPSFLAGMSFDAEDAADPAIAQQRDEARARGDLDEARALTEQLIARVEEIHRPIALAGRVPCKVDGQYGAIHAGDRITSSATPGHAMKQTQSGPSIGVALEDWTAPATGKIIVLIQPGWFGIGEARTAEAMPVNAAGIARELASLRFQTEDRIDQLEQKLAELILREREEQE